MLEAEEPGFCVGGEVVGLGGEVGEVVTVLEVSFPELGEIYVGGDVFLAGEDEWVVICYVLVVASECAGAAGGVVVGAVGVAVVDGDGAGIF